MRPAPAPFAQRKGRERSERGMPGEGGGGSRPDCAAILPQPHAHTPRTRFACARPFHVVKGADRYAPFAQRKGREAKRAGYAWGGEGGSRTDCATTTPPHHAHTPRTRFAPARPFHLVKGADRYAPFAQRKGREAKPSGVCTGRGRGSRTDCATIPHPTPHAHTPRTRFACARPFHVVKGASKQQQKRTASALPGTPFFSSLFERCLLALPYFLAPLASSGYSLGGCRRLLWRFLGGGPRGRCWRLGLCRRFRACIGVGSGVGVGIGAGAPSLPTARFAGRLLRLPHTCVPLVPRRTEADRIVSVSSGLMATIARSEMFVRSSSGSGRHAVAGEFST